MFGSNFFKSDKVLPTRACIMNECPSPVSTPSILLRIAVINQGDFRQPVPNKNQPDSDNVFWGGVLTDESVGPQGKRLLRSESESTVSTIDEEGDEARVISVSGATQSIKTFVQKLRAWIKNDFSKKFTEYMNDGKTPAAVRKELDESGAYMSWALLSRNKHYAERYEAWLKQYHPKSPLLHREA
ncbi:unnamed protein product [Phytophthora lilii]|uniref:Unnamed protein product n=1 Tax=Phytophthora lilii TaxID=2077276 RepID=A0A9W6UA73_9STRA|nr:unnamed protein product [Phytophthora lilii]